MLPLLRCFFAHLLILQYPDHHQNLISSSLYYSGPVHKISSQSIHNFLSNVVHRQTDRQTDRQTNQRYQKHNLFCQGCNELGPYVMLWQHMTISKPTRERLYKIVTMDKAETLDIQLMMMLEKVKKHRDVSNGELPSMEKYIQVSALEMPSNLLQYLTKQ